MPMIKAHIWNCKLLSHECFWLLTDECDSDEDFSILERVNDLANESNTSNEDKMLEEFLCRARMIQFFQSLNSMTSHSMMPLISMQLRRQRHLHMLSSILLIAKIFIPQQYAESKAINRLARFSVCMQYVPISQWRCFSLFISRGNLA